MGGRERKREREQLILDREQLRQPLSPPSFHLPSSLVLLCHGTLPLLLQGHGPYPKPPDPSSTDAYDLQLPSGITIVPLVKIYSLKTGTCPPPSTSSGLAQPQLKLSGASEVLPGKAMAKCLLLAEAFPA